MKIKLSDEDLRKLLIEGTVKIGKITLDVTNEFKYPKEIFDLLQTRQYIDEHIMKFYRCLNYETT